MSRTLPSPPTQTLQTLTEILLTSELETSVINLNSDGFLNFLNSLTDDLQYTIEYPSQFGTFPSTYMAIHIHPDYSTSVLGAERNFDSVRTGIRLILVRFRI